MPRSLPRPRPSDGHIPKASQAAHATAPSDVLESLASRSDQGLTVTEAARRLAAEGANVLVTRDGPSRWEVLRRQFASVLVWLLIVAAVISGAVLGELVDMVRDGTEIDIASADVVTGDIVILDAGSAVPADGRVLDLHWSTAAALIQQSPVPVLITPMTAKAEQQHETAEGI